MVNDNGTPASGEPKRRRLFGSRRATSAAGSAAPEPIDTAPAGGEEPPASAPLEVDGDVVERGVDPEHAPASPAETSVVTEAGEVPLGEPDAAEPDAAAVPAEPEASAKPKRSRRAPAKSAAAHVNTDGEPALVPAADVAATQEHVEQQDAATSTADEVAEPEAPAEPAAVSRPSTSLLFQAPDIPTLLPARPQPESGEPTEGGNVRKRSRRRSGESPRQGDDDPNTTVRVREPKQAPLITEPQKVKGSTRLEAKKQRRRDGRDAGRRRPVITESEFLARREAVDRAMVVRSKPDRIQIAVLEDGVLVEHYVAKSADMSLIGNVYLGRVQNVLPSMEAAFVDIGRGRNAVLYSGEVDWDSVETGNQPRRIELALKAGDKVLVQVTKDPVGHKGARLTSQVSLPGRYLVYVPNGSMNGISRKLPDTERARLKKILKEKLPENTGVIVRTAAEGATEEQLTLDVQRLANQWEEIQHLVETAQAPVLLHSEPDLLVKIVRDVFNEDFHRLVISGDDAKQTIERYLGAVAPDLLERVETYEGDRDPFDEFRVTEQIEKALERKVWLPSGGSLVIDRTEAMTVIDVNTGKFVGSGGNLEETVTKNNLEAAEEIVRQLRLRDTGGIIVVDFIDMVLESNRDLVLRRLVECLSRDRTKHQVAEVTSLGLVQMTRKKIGLGLLETFSEPCEVCAGRGVIVHHDPVTKHRAPQQNEPGTGRRSRGKGSSGQNQGGSAGSAPKSTPPQGNGTHAITEDVSRALAQIAAKTVHTEALREGQDAEAATSAEAATVAAAEAAVAILDIPVEPAAKERGGRRLSAQDAEDILGAVLEHLPEPKQPGQGRTGQGRGGRGRGSRRASSSGSATPPATPES